MNLAEILNNKTVLITGGTGSFGHAVVTRFLRTRVREIRILSHELDRAREAMLGEREKCLTGKIVISAAYAVEDEPVRNRFVHNVVRGLREPVWRVFLHDHM